MEKELLYRFFEGSVTFEEEERIRLWTESSIENKKTLLKERKFYDAVILSGKGSVAKGGKLRPLLFLHKYSVEFAKIAAVIAITLLGSYFFTKFTKGDKSVAMQTIFVPSGQRINLTLADGTNVWLNANTKLEYPTQFAGKNRSVKLEGEAFFDVSKDKNRPFIVETKKWSVQVLGTQFNIEAYSDRDEFETALLKGSVNIFKNDLPAVNFNLKPDTKFIQTGNKAEVVKIDDLAVYRWKEGLICFKDETLDGIMTEFEKYYGFKVIIKNDNLSNLHFTGKFRQSDGIDYAMRILQKEIAFSYERDEKRNTIIIK